MPDEFDDLITETPQDTEGIKKLRRLFKEVRDERNQLRTQVGTLTTDNMIASAGLTNLNDLQRSALKAVMDTAGDNLDVNKVKELATSLNFVPDPNQQQNQQSQQPQQQQGQQQPGQVPNQGQPQQPNSGFHPASTPGQQQVPGQQPNMQPGQQPTQPQMQQGMQQPQPNQPLPGTMGQMPQQQPGQQPQPDPRLAASMQAMTGMDAANQQAVQSGQGQSLVDAINAAKAQGPDAVRNVIRTRGGEAAIAHNWDT